MRRFLSILFGDDTADGGPASGHSDAHVAAAALMVEAARLDGSFTDAERQRIQKLLVERFRLNPWMAGELLARAERTATESVAWQGFTQATKDTLPPDERIWVIERLSKVACAVTNGVTVGLHRKAATMATGQHSQRLPRGDAAPI